jgi:hypothetical protein
MAKTKKKIKSEYDFSKTLETWTPVYESHYDKRLIIDSSVFLSRKDAIEHTKNCPDKLLGFKTSFMSVIKKDYKNGKN